MRALRRCLAPLLAGTLFSAASARGDELTSRQAQALFDRGREMMESGDLAQACALLAESQHLDPGGGTLLNVAVCHEKQGRLATAWTEYHEALSISFRDDRKDRQALASDRIRALEIRLPHLVVVLPASFPEGAELAVDGAPLSRLTAGTPLPVDPGLHEVVAKAPGYATWSMKLAPVDEGQSLRVEVPALVPSLPTPLATAPSKPSPAHLATGSYVSGGVALAGYTTMAITGVLALEAQSSANQVCSASRQFCSDPSGPSDASRARALAWVSTVSLGVAVAATVLAVVWPRARSAPAVGVSASGLVASF